MAVQFVRSEVFPYGMAPADEEDALRLVEICGRTAYKSEDKISVDSARAFVLMLKKHGHLSVLEHSNAVLKVRPHAEAGQAAAGQSMPAFVQALVGALKDRNAYHRIHVFADPAEGFAMSGNFRGWIETLQYLRERHKTCYQILGRGFSSFYPSLSESAEQAQAEPQTELSLLTAEQQLAILKHDPSSDLPVFVFKIVCDRGITHEIVRHRVLSFTQESTRYVNYKNRGMVLILPEELDPYYDSETGGLRGGDPLVQTWLDRAARIFQWYQEDIGRGRRPEIARDILPNLLKSEIFVSGRWSGWRHFVLLRDSRQAHPRVRLIAQKIRTYFESIGLHCA